MLIRKGLSVLSCLIGVQVTAAAQVSVPAASITETTANTLEIRGQVLEPPSEIPVSDATVTMLSELSQDQPIQGTTDKAGGFQFVNLRPGRYRISISKSGYGNNNGTLVGRAATSRTVTLRPLASDSPPPIFKFFLRRPGSISGRVLNRDGEPVVRARVTALRSQTIGSGSLFTEAGASVVTDDEGRYRLFDILPGRYLVRVVPRQPIRFGSIQPGNTNDRTTAEHVRDIASFYPGVVNAGDAELVVVRSAVNLPLNDIILQRSRVFRLAGNVAGVAQGSVGRPVVTIAPANVAGLDRNSAVPTPEDGFAFHFDNLSPGAYKVTAHVLGQRESEVASVIVELRDRDLVGLKLVSIPPQDVTIRLSNEQAKTPGCERIPIRLAPVNGGLFSPSFEAVATAGAKELVIKDVPAGAYDLVTPNLPGNCYVSSASYGGRDVLHKGFVISAGLTLDISVKARAASILATVKGPDDKPFGDAFLILFDSSTLETGGRPMYGIAYADQDGVASISGLRPGLYLLFAFDWFDTSLLTADSGALKQFEREALRVDVEEDHKYELSPRVIQFRQ